MHVDKTVIKIKGKRYYIWTLIDSETKYVIDWYLTTSREVKHLRFICLIRSKSDLERLNQ
ncbi:MAG: DDE-type integrase/transposase/recombinase [Cetobacterium sp.]